MNYSIFILNKYKLFFPIFDTLFQHRYL